MSLREPLLLEKCKHGFQQSGCTAAIRSPDHMVDDDWLRWHQERVQSLWNLGELHPLRLKDLQEQKMKQKKKKITQSRSGAVRTRGTF